MPTYKAGNPESKASTLLEAGEYPFEVADAKEKTAKSGNAMIELRLKVGDDHPATVFDNLVFTPNAFWKIDQFLKAIGKHPGEGEDIDVEPFDLIGEKGTCKIKVGKNQSGDPKNEIEAYLFAEPF